MLKHIVMWQLKPTAEGRSMRENARLLKKQLEALVGEIPGLLKIEVGFDASTESPEIVLYSELKNRAALEAYRTHPAHQAVIPFVQAVTAARQVVDYEV